ncbi:Trypanosomal VSG domain containing protein, putative [Trypanosoma equiperdum]|uniref:Trypanosomal VSG domain containing protein, putative n=1 Tax=Trypanosoma equiperdum TaxID=5694 RepID=A0A1G4IJR3_TRYEQ|nr:Trypanosomal VSG domain containing protein, putative [Trypanosoma equiperdum]
MPTQILEHSTPKPTSRQGQRALLAAIALCSLISITERASTAPDTADSAAGAFGVLCELIKLARSEGPQKDTVTDLSDFAETKALLNISLAAPHALPALKDDKESGGNVKTAEEPLKTQCGSTALEGCKLAKARLTREGKGQLPRTLWTGGADPAIKSAINETLNAMGTTITELTQQLKQTETNDAKAQLQAALGTEPTATATLAIQGASTNRKTTCGKPSDGTAGTGAGKTLAADMICLCGSEAGGDANNKACKLQTATGTIQYDSAVADVQTEWKKLADQCPEAKYKEPVTPQLIMKGLAAFDALRAKQHGDNGKLTNLLGHLNSAGSDGCDGKTGGNGGNCVYYGHDPISKKPKQPEWYDKLVAAAAKLDAADKARHRSAALEQKLRSLNSTLTALIQLTALPSGQQKDQAKAPTATSATNPTATGSSTNCPKLKNNKEGCEADSNCIWKGGESKTGTCEVNTTKVAEQAKQAGTGEGATSGADPNCGQYTDPEKCTKAPGKPKEGKKSVFG